MKYYSELTKEVYDTPELLEEAEKVVLEANKEKERKLTERAERAKAVEKAFAEAREARKKADELLSEFCKDYGSFHTTIKEPTDAFGWFDDWFNSYFKL